MRIINHEASLDDFGDEAPLVGVFDFASSNEGSSSPSVVRRGTYSAMMDYGKSRITGDARTYATHVP